MHEQRNQMIKLLDYRLVISIEASHLPPLLLALLHADRVAVEEVCELLPPLGLVLPPMWATQRLR